MIYRGMDPWSNCTACVISRLRLCSRLISWTDNRTGKLHLEIELLNPKKRSMDY